MIAKIRAAILSRWVAFVYINKESDSATSATQEKCHCESVNHKPTSIHLSGMTGCSIQDGASLYFWCWQVVLLTLTSGIADAGKWYYWDGQKLLLTFAPFCTDVLPDASVQNARCVSSNFCTSQKCDMCASEVADARVCNRASSHLAGHKWFSETERMHFQNSGRNWHSSSEK